MDNIEDKEDVDFSTDNDVVFIKLLVKDKVSEIGIKSELLIFPETDEDINTFLLIELWIDVSKDDSIIDSGQEIGIVVNVNLIIDEGIEIKLSLEEGIDIILGFRIDFDVEIDEEFWIEVNIELDKYLGKVLRVFIIDFDEENDKDVMNDVYIEFDNTLSDVINVDDIIDISPSIGIDFIVEVLIKDEVNIDKVFDIKTESWEEEEEEENDIRLNEDEENEEE